MTENMYIQPGDPILYLGFGTGRNAKLICSYLNDNGHTTGIDIPEHMGKQFYRKLEKDKFACFINKRVDVPFDLKNVQ